MAETTPEPESFALTRDYLLSGGLRDFILRNNPDIRLLTDAERAESLAAILDARPERGGGIWIFAYGSLIWNPAIHIVERRVARAVGWHRDYCLATKGGRGNATTPGMMLGLEQGGDCVGAVLRVAEEAIAVELDILWRREMIADGYIPRWVEVTLPDGAPLGHAIAFTINPDGASYSPPLPDGELVRRLALARGPLGTAAEYLFNTRDGLRGMGITDPLLERLGDAVSAFHSTMD